MGKHTKKGTREGVRSWLIALRNERGLTQGAVAMAAGIAQPSYFEIENGITSPKIETAKRIAAALGFDWTRFYEEEESDDVDAYDEKKEGAAP